MALALHPPRQVDGDLHSLLLQTIERLWDARQERLLAAQTTIPDIVWFVVIVGGALTVAFGSFLGAPSMPMQLAMSAMLAASGALVLILIIALSNPFRGFPGFDYAIRACAVTDGSHSRTTIIPIIQPKR
jgi:hypothetical protein